MNSLLINFFILLFPFISEPTSSKDGFSSKESMLEESYFSPLEKPETAYYETNIPYVFPVKPKLETQVNPK